VCRYLLDAAGLVATAWALLGGILAMLRLGLFSYWVNTYAGGGMITGLGGALVLGALPRLMKTARFRYGIVMAIGMILLGLTRPYEGVLLCLPVAVALGHWALFGKNRPRPAVLLRRAAAPLLADCCCRILAGLLRLPRVWKAHDLAVYHQPGNVRRGPVFRMAVAAA